MARLTSVLAPHQTQKLAPAQQQSLAILQLPAPSLVATIEAALAENPLLQRQDEPRSATQSSLPRRRFAAGRGGMPMAAQPPSGPAGMPAGVLDAAAEDIADPGATGLHAHLANQLALEMADPVDRAIGLSLIDLLDEAGYLTDDPSSVAAHLGLPQARVNRVLEQLRMFEPEGVFARSLADCLALQLDEDERADPAMRCLLDNLHLLASDARARLIALCKVDAAKLDAMIARLRGLDPKPGLRFGQPDAIWIVPDVVVERDDSTETGYRVQLNPALAPGCALDNETYRRLMSAARTRDDRASLRSQYDSARNLLSALERRGATLLAIAETIGGRQRGFLDTGIGMLETLTRREIASQLSLDESTIGRAVAGKTMAMPRGTYGFEFFFDRGLRQSHRRGAKAAVSAARVKARLAAIVSQETEPLDDAALAVKLAGEGIPIARRTVAKYRESLKILPARRRRAQRSLHRP